MTPSDRTAPPYAVALKVVCGVRETTGSGILVSERHILTCAHVIASAVANQQERRSLAEPVASAAGAIPSVRISATLGGCDRARIPWHEDIVFLAEDRHADLALLELERPVRGFCVPWSDATQENEFAEKAVLFARQNEAWVRTELDLRNRLVERSGDGVEYVSHGIGAQAGYSGAAVISPDADGTPRVVGIAVVGGLNSPVGRLIGLGAISRFLLSRDMDLRHEEEVAGAPGIRRKNTIGTERGAMTFLTVRTARGLVRRADRPLSVADLAKLTGKADRQTSPPSAISARMPAHFADAQAAITALDDLGRCGFGRMELPEKLTDIDLFLAEGSHSAGFPGLPPLLSVEASPGTPAGQAEWVLDPDGVPAVCFHDPVRGAPRLIGLHDQRPAHLRVGLQPLVTWE